MWQRKSQVFYCEMNSEWTAEEYAACSRKERSGYHGLRSLFGSWEWWGKDLRMEDEYAVHILHKCSETRKMREQLLSRMWCVINEELVYKRIINCTNSEWLQEFIGEKIIYDLKLSRWQDSNERPEAPWAPVYHIPDDEDRDGPRNVGYFYSSFIWSRWSPDKILLKKVISTKN
jgi:hypothetical protein